MKKTTPLRPRYTENGTGQLIFPRGAPCDHCGKPVLSTRGNILIVMEPEDEPLWLILHRRCARRMAETLRKVMEDDGFESGEICEIFLIEGELTVLGCEYID